MSFENEEDLFEHLVKSGALKPAGKNKNNEILFVFDIDILKEVYPEMFDALQEELDEDLKKLYELGFVDISYNENLEATFKITEKGKQYLSESHND